MAIAVLRGGRTAAFSPDGTRVVTGSDDATAHLGRRQRPVECVAVLRGHEDAVNSAVYSPDGARVGAASDDQSARIWDAADVGFTANIVRAGISYRSY